VTRNGRTGSTPVWGTPITTYKKLLKATFFIFRNLQALLRTATDFFFKLFPELKSCSWIQVANQDSTGAHKRI